MSTDSPLILGTRGSDLALTQASHIRDLLAEHHAASGLQVQIEIIRTTGDVSRSSLSQIGGQGVFTREIERALLDGRIDLAVHSLKDLPTEIDTRLVVAATPPRADVRDALVTRGELDLQQLPQGATLGTGSARRRAQLLCLRPDLELQDMRGNVGTRLGKVEDGTVDGVILAAAGLRRLGLQDRISAYLDTTGVLPAPGQGALGLQMRKDDARLPNVQVLNHEPTWRSISAERGFLNALGGGCQAPIAAWGRQVSDELRLDGLVGRPDGSVLYQNQMVGIDGEPEELGRSLADDLLGQGADAILREFSS